MLWPMAPQGTQRPYENQPASLQGWGHQRYCHIPKLALALDSLSSCWMPGSHPSPLCHLFPARLPGGVSEKFRDRHHPGWCTYYIGWALQQCQGPMPWARSSFSYIWVKKRQCQTEGAPVKTPPGSHGIIPRTLPPRQCSQAEVWPFLWWTP